MSWWAELYDDALADILLVRADPTETDRTLTFLTKILNLKPGARIYDQCCGIGSLSIPLARAGFEVIGVDQAARYIERARQAGPDIEFHAADAFEFVAPQCDAVFNWWTSFGYALTDTENKRMFERAFESLRPGGWFALDYLNVPQVLREFTPDVRVERDGKVLHRHSSIDLASGTMRKRWVYEDSGQTKESVARLYMPDQIARLLSDCGFTSVEAFGEIDGAPLELDSRRCIMRGRRP